MVSHLTENMVDIMQGLIVSQRNSCVSHWWGLYTGEQKCTSIPFPGLSYDRF